VVNYFINQALAVRQVRDIYNKVFSKAHHKVEDARKKRIRGIKVRRSKMQYYPNPLQQLNQSIKLRMMSLKMRPFSAERDHWNKFISESASKTNNNTLTTFVQRRTCKSPSIISPMFNPKPPQNPKISDSHPSPTPKLHHLSSISAVDYKKSKLLRNLPMYQKRGILDDLRAMARARKH